MEIRTKTLAWSALGLALGAPPGLSAPSLFESKDSAIAAATATAPAAASGSSQAPDAPIPPITAPNYRAIVARNQAAVVGITIAGEMKVSAPQEFGFGIPND